MGQEDIQIDVYSLNFIVSQSLYLLKIDPLTGPEGAGHTEREFGMYVLSGIHQSGGIYQLVQLNRELLDQIKVSLGIIAEHGLRGDAINVIEKTKSRRPKPQEQLE